MICLAVTSKGIKLFSDIKWWWVPYSTYSYAESHITIRWPSFKLQLIVTYVLRQILDIQLPIVEGVESHPAGTTASAHFSTYSRTSDLGILGLKKCIFECHLHIWVNDTSQSQRKVILTLYCVNNSWLGCILIVLLVLYVYSCTVFRSASTTIWYTLWVQRWCFKRHVWKWQCNHGDRV